MLQQKIEKLTATPTENVTGMVGFDPEFNTYPDYLMHVVRAIWENRGLATAARGYLHQQMVRRSPLGIDFGPESTAREASEMLAMFPDLQMLTEDVMWTGTPQRGFLGSQRMLCKGRYTHSGTFGPARGTDVSYRVITDSYAKANKISDQWTVQDTGAILRQLGWDIPSWVRSIRPHINPDVMPFTPEKDELGPYTSTGEASEWGQVQKEIMTRIMDGEGNVIAEQYDPSCQVHYPGGVTATGWSAAEAFWFGLRNAMPDAKFEFHHVIGSEDILMPARAAVRWSLTGQHAGWGAFGAPSGAQLHVMGITHVEFGPWGLRREWTLFDEAAIALQIACASN